MCSLLMTNGPMGGGEEEEDAEREKESQSVTFACNTKQMNSPTENLLTKPFLLFINRINTGMPILNEHMKWVEGVV